MEKPRTPALFWDSAASDQIFVSVAALEQVLKHLQHEQSRSPSRHIGQTILIIQHLLQSRCSRVD